MNRMVFTTFMLIFSISFCMAQNIREARQREEQEQQAAEAQRKAAEEKKQRAAQQQRAADEQKKRDLEIRYLDAIESAEKNFGLQQYEEARNNYATALEIKPENAASINPKIEEIDKLIRQREEAENELIYQKTIEFAQKNFEQQQYEQALQHYIAAREIKPEETAYINAKIREIEKRMNEPALLHIYRKRRPLDILPKRYDVIIDNTIVATTTNNWKTTVTINTFELKEVSATIDGRKAAVNISFISGETYYLRCDIKSKSVETGRTKTTTDRNGKTITSKETELQYTPILQLVDKGVGESEFNAIVPR